jgi:hypothetical protein
MNLREQLQLGVKSHDRNNRKRFESYGVIANPFPSAGEPSGHPHLPGPPDIEIARRIKTFYEDAQSQVLLVVGTQGVGKTNLLAYYETALREAFDEETGYYIIRYYADPEPSFDGILRRLFQELGTDHLINVGEKLREEDEASRQDILRNVRSRELRTAFGRISEAAAQGEEELRAKAELFLEWLVGLRVVNKHRDALGVQFRLDTVESRTQVLRDVVECSQRIGLLKGIFLLLDELEKQDYSVTKLVLLRYLSAVRAIIDALPGRLFLMIALTPVARQRYFEMLPAFQGRLQNSVELKALTDESTSLNLFSFYLEKARELARRSLDTPKPSSRAKDLLTPEEVRVIFNKALARSKNRGSEGVPQRDFLNDLHEAAAVKLDSL